MNEYTYDFTSIMEREGMDAMAVDVPEHSEYIHISPTLEGFDRIPMWVADMNFPTVPTVVESITKRAIHPAYGYFHPREEYFEKIILWHKLRKGVEDLEAEHIGYENSVLGGLNSAMRVMCSSGEKVLLHTPVYAGFIKSLERNGYRMIQSPLYLDENNVWRMNFQHMEEMIVTHSIHCTIFCSPHNPTGRAWELWELEKAMELFEKYDVAVISDEIWSDLLLGEHKHIPLQSVSEDAKQRTVALYAPSKTFNLAGLVGAYHVIYNKYWRDRIRTESSLGHYNEMNVLSMYALIGAYSPEGMAWVEELCSVLEENVNLVTEYVTEKVDGVSVSKPDSTYLVYLDCTTWCETHQMSLDQLIELGYKYGVIWQDGRLFGGTCHIRMNLALPKSRVLEALKRLETYVFL